MGLTPILLILATTVVVRNLRVIDSFEARLSEDERRRQAGMAPKLRRRQRKGLTELLSAAATPP